MKLLNRIKFMKANILYNQGNVEGAHQIYKGLVKNKNLSESIILQAAYISLNCGDLNTSKLYLDKINFKKLTNNNYKISFKQSESLYLWKTGHINKAIAELKELDQKLENTATYETLGYLLIVNKNYEEALEYNKKAYDYNKTNVIIDNLAESYYYLNEFDKAYKLYSKMLENTENLPTFPEVYYYYGLLLKKKSNISEANKYFNIALEKKESYLSILTKDMIKKEIE